MEREREQEWKVREGWEERKGKGRKLINSNHRALIPRRAKDRSARLRLTALATVSFVIHAGRKAHGEVARACARNGDLSAGDFPRWRFSRASIGWMYTVSSVEIHPSQKLTCAIKISSALSLATRKKQKELEAKNREKRNNSELREGKNSREMRVYFLGIFFWKQMYEFWIKTKYNIAYNYN